MAPAGAADDDQGGRHRQERQRGPEVGLLDDQTDRGSVSASGMITRSQPGREDSRAAR